MKLAHCTDIHLDHLSESRTREFFRSVLTLEPDAIVSTGDMSIARLLETHLDWMQAETRAVPIYFVLGNHDFYGSSIATIRASIGRRTGRAVYLTTAEHPVSLGDGIAIIGHDGWYDGGYSDWFASRINMTDYNAIAEFRSHSRDEWFALIQHLADEAAQAITTRAREAAKTSAAHVIIATHVPPFATCSRAPTREQSDGDWLPVMSSKRVGDAIRAVAEEFPAVRFTVLCGHTHTPWRERLTVNLECIVGDADTTGTSGYGHPMWSLLDV